MFAIHTVSFSQALMLSAYSSKPLTFKESHMYSIFMTVVSLTFMYIGASHVEGGWLFILSLIAGGVYFGHVITEALNK